MSKKERVFNVAFGVGIFGIVYAMFLNLFSPSYVTVAFTNAVTYAQDDSSRLYLIHNENGLPP